MQVIQGDCLEEMQKIPDKSIDMINKENINICQN